MLVAGIDMGLGPDTHDSVKMMHVHVDKDPVETC